LPAITLDNDSVFYLLQGQSVWRSGFIPAGLLRLYSEQPAFLGLGELQPDGKIAPKRLIQQANN
jgi:tRNA pseudouridine55 synthase